MSGLILVLIWVVNFAISWWNARCCGVAWSVLKERGGWPQFMGWMGAIMSASGFTWCYLIVLLLGGFYFQPAPEPGHAVWLTMEQVNSGLSLGYVLLIPGILFSGLMIWVDSVAQAWKTRNIGDIAIAGWNTYANASNIYHAARDMPSAWSSAGKLFKSDAKAEHKAALLVIVLVVMAALGGIFTTMGLIRHYGRKARFEEMLAA